MNGLFVLSIALKFFGSISADASADTNYCLYKCKDTANIGCGNNLTLADTCKNENATLYQFNTTEQKIIVDDHNKYRNSVANGSVTGLNSTKLQSACRMAQMVWSAALALLACFNAKGCIYGHDYCHATPRFNYSGQNIAQTGESDKYPDMMPCVQGQMGSWFSEYKNTTNDDLRSMPKSPNYTIGHFTAMVNDRAIEVGCCSLKYLNGGFYSIYTVCNYAQTNIVNSATYKVGTPCSECKTGCDPTYKSMCSRNETVDPNKTNAY